VSASIELWKAAFALVGVVIAALIPYIAAYRTAAKRGLTNSTLEEIKDRAAFRESQQKAVKVAQDTASVALEQVEKLIKRIGGLVDERDLLFESNTRLRGEREILITRLDHCEKDSAELRTRFDELMARFELHEKLCPPKLIEGDVT
jgi:predicted nuclease with TOPRIM domain